jgi:hypothetical protein
MATYDASGPPPIALAQSTLLDVPAQATFTLGVLYFQMRGYYAAGAAFETWTTTNAPSTSPPSGHSLTGLAVVGRWSG